MLRSTTEVVRVGQKEDLNAALDKLVKDTGVVERLKKVNLSWWVLVGHLWVGCLWCWEKRVLED